MSLGKDIEGALSNSGDFASGFFMVYEAFGEDGERMLHYVYSDDLAYWQAFGYLGTAMENLADIIQSADLEDEDDDDE